MNFALILGTGWTALEEGQRKNYPASSTNRRKRPSATIPQTSDTRWRLSVTRGGAGNLSVL